MKEYGNDRRTVCRAFIAGCILGVFTIVAAIAGITWENRWQNARVSVLPLLFLAPALGLGGIVGLTACFSIRIIDGKVQHRLLRRFTFQEYPLSDFVEMKHRPFPTIHFNGGRAIWFLGANLYEISRLEKDLTNSDTLETSNESPLDD